MRLIWGTVTEVVAQREGCCELRVVVDGRAEECVQNAGDPADTRGARAVAYPALTGDVAVGDRVLLNTTAVDLGLGTGGRHYVVARIVAADADGTGNAGDGAPEGLAFEERMDVAQGHIMKLRYSPLQFNVLSVEAQESPYHAIMEQRDSLDGIPVVCCGLHSQVPLVAAAIKKAAAHLRVGYVMDDAASLALPLSFVLAQAVEAGLVDCTVSTGQAFGGQLEAVNLHSGLLAAAHIGGCDVLITAIGPGLAGTGTPFGHGGVAQGEAINAVAALGGSPVVCLRMSQADERERHLGISHHSLIALSRIAAAPTTVALPYLASDCPVRERVESQLDALPNMVGHDAFQLEEAYYDAEALRGMTVTTMGRSFGEDPLFFEAATAAGAVAAMLAVREPVPESEQRADGAADGTPFDPQNVPPCVAKFDIMGALSDDSTPEDDAASSND